MFHVNDVRNFLICKRLFVNTLNSERINYQQYIHMDEALSIIASKKLLISDAFFGQRGDQSDKTLSAMDYNEWLIKARFEYNNLRVKIPFMHKHDKTWDIYFVRNELFPKEDSLMYMTDSLWVLKKLMIDINQVFIIHFNQDYIRNGEIDYDKLMTISDRFYNHHNNQSNKIIDMIDNKTRDLTKTLNDMETFNIANLKKPVRERKCTNRFRCRFYEDCFPEESNLDDNSILTLMGSEKKYKMFRDGVLTLADADLDMIEGTRQQYAQIMADRNGGLFVDKANLSLWLKDTLKMPLSFLDFEWDRYAIPPYDGMKPFDVLLFQYSLHVFNKRLKHKEFIGMDDCRIEFIESLLHDLPKKGSIIAFNTSGGEALRLRELQVSFPQYHQQIEDVINRLVDFSVPFNLGIVYHLKMKGFYSLKKIVEVIDENYSYKRLAIPQAMMAVDSWRKLNNVKDSEEEKELLDSLFAYCAMDTYSLYLIYQWFQEICEWGE